MTSKFYGVRYKSVYISPLAEEVLVSFEENLLQATGSGALANPNYGGFREAGDLQDNGNPFGGDL